MYSIDLALISLRGEQKAPKMADTLLHLPYFLYTLRLAAAKKPQGAAGEQIQNCNFANIHIVKLQDKSWFAVCRDRL